MYSYPYTRSLWLPHLLSPIQEEDESFDIHTMFRNSESTGFRAEGVVLSNQNQSAPRVVSLERNVIESSSGRRQSSVEVLKQKYINDDIQDIPRLIQGPVRYGRISRSRSNLNLGSQDIRTQLNKIRLRMGVLHYGEDENQAFRCARMKTPSPLPAPLSFGTLGELLYGAASAEEDDPELAALFEDYVEECDKPTRVTPVTEHSSSLRDRYVLGRILMERVLKTETRFAFLSGLLEGAGQHEAPENEAETLDKVLRGRQGADKEPARDPCIDPGSLIDLIKNNQDITHKFLKEWEQGNRSDSPADKGCIACHHENAKRISESKGRQSDSTLTSDRNNGTVGAEPKSAQKRSTLPLGKTELDLCFPNSSNSATKIKEHSGGGAIKRPVLKKLPRLQKSDQRLSPADVPPLLGTKITTTKEDNSESINQDMFKYVGKAGDATDESCVGTRFINGVPVTCLGEAKGKSSRHMCCTVPHVPSHPGAFKGAASGRYTPNFDNHGNDSQHLGTESSEVIAKRKPFYGVTADDDVSIIALAKQKLENKYMSSALLEDLCRKNPEKADSLKSRRSGCRGHAGKDDAAKNRKGNPETDIDLDGWTTSTKGLSEPDNSLRVSSSEMLHPVVLESPSEDPDNIADLKDIRKDNSLKLKRQPTPTSAKLSDLDDKNCRSVNFETNAFKHRSPLSKDFKKAASHVKLRLTKSCANMPTENGHKDAVFANVPLATCSSYYVEEKLKSSPQITPQVNLSEKLAHQLRTISRGKGKNNDSDAVGDMATESRQERSKSTNTPITLPSIEKESIKDKDILSVFTGKDIILPEISKCTFVNDTGQKDAKNTNEALPVYDRDVIGAELFEETLEPPTPGRSTSIDLPPISVTSYQRATPIKIDATESKRETPRSLYDFDNLENYPNGSVAVRAEMCMSQYQFDKADPNKLMVKAKSVSNKHSVCCSCGGISERFVATPVPGKEERPVQRCPEKTVHPQCSSPSDNKRWKLEKAHSEHQLDLPKLEGAKLINKYHSQEEVKSSPCPPASSCNHTTVKRKSKKSGSEEMSFTFMGQNIKLKFECEINAGSSSDKKPRKDNKKDDITDKCKRLIEIAKPTCRDNLKSRVSKETGIYKKKSKPVELTDCRSRSKSPSRDSPYVEYCKRRTAMRNKRQLEQDGHHARLPTDDIPDVKQHQMAIKRFPVIPAKRSRERFSSRLSSDTKPVSKLTFGSDDNDGTSLFIQSGRLPLLNTTPRSKTASGNQKPTSSVQHVAANCDGVVGTSLME